MTLPPPVAEVIAAVVSGRAARDCESATLDFKTVGRSVPDTLESLAETAACFANAAGGVVVVGVADQPGGRDALLGCDLDDEQTQRKIYEVTQPHLLVSVNAAVVDDARLLVITVPRSPDVHQVKNRATERIGTACEPMTAARIAVVVSERHGDDWSAADAQVAPDSVSPRAVEAARRSLKDVVDPERRRWAELSQPDLLRRLGVVSQAGTLTNAGALLFVSDDSRHVIAYTHRRTRSGELTTNTRLPAPALTAVERCFELIENRTDRTPVNLPTGQQLFIADLPDAAVRESIVNAIMHRDYTSVGMIQVEHAPSRMSVTSPGAFLQGVTPQNVLTVPSRSRNPSLTTAMRGLGLAEAAGVGVDRMYAEMVRVGHEPPVFRSDPTAVTVSLNGGAPNSAVTRFVASWPDERKWDPDMLLIMLALLHRPTVTARVLAPTMQKPAGEVELVLQEASLPEFGFVERTRASARLRQGVYRLRDHATALLGAAVAYRRRVPDDIDRMITTVVRETGQVNGRLARTVLGVDTVTASRILADMVARGLLVKTSEAQRGPSVTYGRGPKFPAARPRSRATKTQGPSD